MRARDVVCMALLGALVALPALVSVSCGLSAKAVDCRVEFAARLAEAGCRCGDAGAE